MKKIKNHLNKFLLKILNKKTKKNIKYFSLFYIKLTNNKLINDIFYHYSILFYSVEYSHKKIIKHLVIKSPYYKFNSSKIQNYSIYNDLFK